IEAFEASLHIDPSYAPALAGLARSYASLGEFWHVPPAQAFSKARAAIAQALQIDEHSGAAHAVLSEILMFADWDWQSAEAELERAMRLSPNSALICNNAAWLRVWFGSFEQAVREARRAILLEPSSPFMHLLMARVLIHAQDFSQAIQYLSNLLETDPGLYIARRYRAQAYLLKGEPEHAIGDLLLLPQERSEEPSFRLPMLGRAYADSGDLERARRIHESLIAM